MLYIYKLGIKFFIIKFGHLSWNGIKLPATCLKYELKIISMQLLSLTKIQMKVFEYATALLYVSGSFE